MCNYISNIVCQKYEGWWCCFVVEKDTQYGSRFFNFESMFIDVTIESKRFTIFKSSM